MCDHDLPFDVESEPVVEPYRYKFGATSIEWLDPDVVAFEASAKYVEVVLRWDNRRPLLTDTLKTLISDQRYSEHFIQIHRSTLIRAADVHRMRHITATGQHEVVTLCGLVFPVSRRFVRAVRQALAAL